MSGEELKEKLKSFNVILASVAEGLGISTQALNSKFKSNDVGIGFIKEIALIINKNVYDLIDDNSNIIINETKSSTYLQSRRNRKLNTPTVLSKTPTENKTGIPIYDIPVDASFLERYRDDGTFFEPIGFLNLPKLRNCNFAAPVSGNSMYPLMKSGSIAICRIIENLDYFEEGEMYLISTTNGFETVKYVQTGDKDDELKLIPHNDKIKPSFIKKSMVIRVCLVEAWVNFR